MKVSIARFIAPVIIALATTAGAAYAEADVSKFDIRKLRLGMTADELTETLPNATIETVAKGGTVEGYRVNLDTRTSQVAKLIETLKKGSVAERVDAAKTLGGLYAKSAEEALSAATKADNKSVRDAATKALKIVASAPRIATKKETAMLTSDSLGKRIYEISLYQRFPKSPKSMGIYGKVTAKYGEPDCKGYSNVETYYWGSCDESKGAFLELKLSTGRPYFMSLRLKDNNLQQANSRTNVENANRLREKKKGAAGSGVDF